MLKSQKPKADSVKEQEIILKDQPVNRIPRGIPKSVQSSLSKLYINKREFFD